MIQVNELLIHLYLFIPYYVILFFNIKTNEFTVYKLSFSVNATLKLQHTHTHTHTSECCFHHAQHHVGGVADTHRVEPKLYNGGIVELVNLATHWDETVAVLDLFDVLLPRCLCCYFTQHGLGRHGKGSPWAKQEDEK